MARTCNPGRHPSLMPLGPVGQESQPQHRIVLWDEFSLRLHRSRQDWGSRSSNPEQAKRSARVLFRALESIDTKTAAHSVRVTSMALRFAHHLGLSFREMQTLELTGILHDIGKMAIAADILEKPEPLAMEELEVIQRHPSIGQTLVEIMGLQPQKRLILHHHEHWDGRGYPDGLAREDIPFLCQVVGLADSYDALVSDRPYRKGRNHRQALEEIQLSAGTQFSPELTSEFLEMFQF